MRLRYETVMAQDLAPGDVPYGDLNGNFDWYSETPSGPQLYYVAVVAVTQVDDEPGGGYVLPAYDIVVSPFLNGHETDPNDRTTFHLRAAIPVRIVIGHLSAMWT